MTFFEGFFSTWNYFLTLQWIPDIMNIIDANLTTSDGIFAATLSIAIICELVFGVILVKLAVRHMHKQRERIRLMKRYHRRHNIIETL
jgi:hypothetical protein